MPNTALVPHVIELLKTHYVFPETADEISAVLAAALAEGRYDGADPERLGELVTADLQSVNGDLHLRLRYSETPLSETHDDEATQLRQMQEWSDLACGGVEHAQRLAGNVGLLKIAPLLFPPAVAGTQVVAAMHLLASADALILDLRDCLGGDPNMVALAYGFLTGHEPVQLSGMAKRAPEPFIQAWTGHVPGPKFGPDKPVWVLTSSRTFSGGEALSFDLQEHGRAVVVGERTRGGAHPREGFRVHDHLEVTIPVARSVSPISGGNWEGVGVVPDVETSAEDVLGAAHRLALEAVLKLGNEGFRRQIADEAAQALRDSPPLGTAAV